MMNQSTSSPFPSLLLEKRRVVYVDEVAEVLAVTKQHVLDLIEEGRLQALNVGGGNDCVRVPREFLAELAARLQIKEKELLRQVEAARKQLPRQRPLWRIPIEGWRKFISDRHSHMEKREENGAAPVDTRSQPT